MARQALVAAVVLAALGGTLASADQSVEKARRYRVISKQCIAPAPGVPEAVSRDVVAPAASELGSSAQVEELGPFYWNRNAAQVEELGSFYWNRNAAQVEELGPFYWNRNAAQVEELGPFYWNR
jgi:L-asparaginase/Glu-tRNA(Gln) amidotransferase subunit D